MDDRVVLVCVPAAEAPAGAPPCPVAGYDGFALSVASDLGSLALPISPEAVQAGAAVLTLQAFLVFLTAYGVASIIKVFRDS